MSQRSFLSGASAKITLTVNSQRGRKEDQDCIEWMIQRLWEGCLKALGDLGCAAQYVSVIDIVFPEHDGTVYVWPSVYVVLSVPDANGKQAELYPIMMKFESYWADRYGELPRVSKESVSKEIVERVRHRLHEHGLILEATAHKILKAAVLKS